MTYQGVSTVAGSVLDWRLCMIAILDLQAQPHNSIPCVHIGVRRDLYSKSLFAYLPRGEMTFQVTSRVVCVTRVCGRGQVLLSRGELSACLSSTSQTSEVCNFFFLLDVRV